jgi:hypothetical protein
MPFGLAVPRHVLGSDAVGDALIAQGRRQPIEQRRSVMAADGRGKAFALQLI